MGRVEGRIDIDRFAPWLLLGITVLGAFLRLYQIGAKGLWLDEAFSVWMGWQPLPEMFAWLSRVDQHPPLYYTLLHFWLALGDSASVVRAFSALIGALTIPAVYFLGYQLSGRKVGLLAAFILAISPFHVRFAQETRMYTLLTFNATLALLALARLSTDPRSATEPIGQQLIAFWRTWQAARRAEGAGRVQTNAGYQRDLRDGHEWISTPTQRRFLPLQAIETDLAWLGLILFTAATALTHNTAILFTVATNLFVLGLIFTRKRWPPGEQPGLLRPPSLRNWLLAQLGAFLLWSPWLAAFVAQATGVYREFWIPSPTIWTVLGTLRNFLSDFLPGRIDWAEVIWASYGLAFLLGIIHFRKRAAHLVFLLALFLTPVVGELLVSLRRPIFYDRTLIWVTIPLFLLLAAGISQLRYRPYILAALALLAAVNGLSLREYYNNFEKEQWDEAAAYVNRQAADDDLILFNATWVQIPFDYYFRQYKRPLTKHGLPVDLFDRSVLEPKMTESDLPRLQSLIHGRERVWLVYSHNWYTDPDSLIPRALDQELQLLEKRAFYGLEVRLYGNR